MTKEIRTEYITDNVTIYLPRTFLTENGIEPEKVFETVIVGKEWDFHTTKTLPFLK